MARIKIKDLPKDAKVSREEMKRIRGGAIPMKIGDIKGESTDQDHKDWIIIESMSSPIAR